MRVRIQERDKLPARTGERVYANVENVRLGTKVCRFDFRGEEHEYLYSKYSIIIEEE